MLRHDGAPYSVEAGRRWRVGSDSGGALDLRNDRMNKDSQVKTESRSRRLSRMLIQDRRSKTLRVSKLGKLLMLM